MRTRGWCALALVILLLSSGCEVDPGDDDASTASGREDAGRRDSGTTDAAQGFDAAVALDAGDGGSLRADAMLSRDAAALEDAAPQPDDDGSVPGDAGPGYDAVEASLGAGGGTLTSKDGAAWLTVPAGAVGGDTVFRLARDTSADTSKLGSDAYALGPAGSFLADVELCLTPGVGVDTTQACLGYLDDKTLEWNCEDRCLQAGKGGTLCGQTSHFTSFAILLSGGTKGGEDCDDAYFTTPGGKLTSPDGLAVLTVPDGALSAGLRITVVEPGGPFDKLGSKAYGFLPDGTTFAKDASLCIEPDAASDVSDACLGYYDTSSSTWKCEDTCLTRTGDGKLCGHTTHFTSFAILLSGGKGDDDVCGDAVLGPAGGVLFAPSGKASLTVPVDALKQPTRITFAEPKLDPAGLGSDIFELTPAGLAFIAPSKLCLPLTTGASTDTACLGYLDGTGKWQCQDGCLDAESGTLCGETDHFTNFAILLSGGSGTTCK